MRPSPPCAQMIVVVLVPHGQIPQLRDLIRILSGTREGHVDVVVQDHHEADLAGRVEDAIQRRVEQARGLAGDLRRHEFLVDRELADAAEHARERLQHALDVVGRIHVGRVEAGDHRVETRLLGGRQRLVGHRDRRVGERVVVQRRVGLQVVGGREIAGVPVRPLLLQRDAEQRRSPGLVPHDLQERPDVDALLHVVGQVEVAVVEGIVVRRGGLRGRRRHSRACLRRVALRPAGGANDARAGAARAGCRRVVTHRRGGERHPVVDITHVLAPAPVQKNTENAAETRRTVLRHQEVRRTCC